LRENEGSRVSSLNVAARVAIFAGSIFLVILLILHFLKPEIDPSWRMISEYELGRYGWLMRVAFSFFAISTLSSFFSLRSSVDRIGGKIGNILLLIIVAGIVMGTIFETGSITTPRDEMGTIAMLHNFGGFLAIFFIPFASLFITVNLFREKRNKKARIFAICLVAAMWASSIVFIIINELTYKGVGGPNVPIGWPNRALILFYVLWLIDIQFHAAKNQNKSRGL
jgi:hypothetical protein